MLRSTILSFLGLGSLLALAACGSTAGGDYLGADVGSGGGHGDPGTPVAPPPPDDGSGGAGSVTGTSTGTTTADPTGQGTGSGTLTAGDWDDNLNFGLFQSYVADHLTENSSAIAFPSDDRVVIRVTTSSGDPVSNASVAIGDGAHTFLTAPTATDGQLLYFPGRDGGAGSANLTVTVVPPAGQGNVAELSIPAPSGDAWSLTLPGATQVLPSALDVAFVIDTTGSMGDELEYLKAEVKGIANDLKAAFDGTSIHYGLVLYRDRNMGDEYITRTFDLTGDLGTFAANLAAQGADGGGDDPEAMEEAVDKAAGLSWRGGNTARVAFLIADAPPHDFGYAPYLDAVEKLRYQGVKLYPVAASGVDAEAEYLMRLGAEDTLGRYLFLTDDSGVGGAHMAPHIPCYQVEKLSKLLYRALASELSGTRVEPLPGDVIRSVGDPQDGVCTLDDGTKAYL